MESGGDRMGRNARGVQGGGLQLEDPSPGGRPSVELAAVRGRRVVGVAAAVAAVALSLSCAIPGFGPRAVSPEERRAYDAAMGLLPANPAGAADGLETFLEVHPDSPLADDAAEQLAQLAFAADRSDDGMRWLARILRDYPDGDRASSARLRLAQQEYARDQRDRARQLIAPLQLGDLSRVDQRAALRLRVVLSRTPVERILTLGQLRALLESMTAEDVADSRAQQRLAGRIESVDREIRTALDRAADAELDAMLRALSGRPPASLVALESARRALDGGQLKLAAERLDRAEGLRPSDLESSELRLLRDRLARLSETAAAEAELPPLRALADRPPPRTAGAHGTIGVVLPLSGEFAAFGEQALDGVLLAAKLFGAPPDGEPDDVRAQESAPGTIRWSETRPSETDVRLLVRDTGGDPVRAVAAVRELAARPDVVSIVGPIFSDESMAAAEAADEVDVPLVSLSHREEVAHDHAGVFRTRTAPGDEVGALVRYAYEQLHAERFAVLYPRNRYGRGMRKLFWDAVTARGGKIVAASSYDPDATDFAEPIRDMIGYRFLTNLERRALAERSKIVDAARRLDPPEAGLLRDAAYSILGPEVQPLPPIVDFDVLFIPDAASTVSLIAPALAFHEVRGVTLLGTSEWLDPELLKIARRHVSGAVVSAPFYADSQLPFVRSFVTGYHETFDADPGPYAAQAFDAANLVLVQLAAGRDDRRSLQEGLLDMRAVPGATGVLSMRPDGNARRRPFLVGVRGGRFVALD